MFLRISQTFMKTVVVGQSTNDLFTHHQDINFLSEKILRLKLLQTFLVENDYSNSLKKKLYRHKENGILSFFSIWASFRVEKLVYRQKKILAQRIIKSIHSSLRFECKANTAWSKQGWNFYSISKYRPFKRSKVYNTDNET